MPNLVLELTVKMEEDDGKVTVMVGAYKTRVNFKAGDKDTVRTALTVGMRQLTARTAGVLDVDLKNNQTAEDMLERLKDMKVVGITAVEKVESPKPPSVEDKGDEVSFR